MKSKKDSKTVVTPKSKYIFYGFKQTGETLSQALRATFSVENPSQKKEDALENIRLGKKSGDIGKDKRTNVIRIIVEVIK